MIKDYLLNPRDYWPENRHRNAEKIDRFLSAACGRRDKKARTAHLDKLISLTNLRRDFDSKHLYLVNAGSSGSHWLEAMLGLLPGFINSGEVYLPNKIIDHLSQLNSEQANQALDIIYLAHTRAIHKDALHASLSNSAHLANHHKISRFSANKVAVLLLRNPIDIVMSRTFRKSEYRQDIAAGLDDKAYLEKNCQYVENFYNGLDAESFDLIVSYEAFVEEPRQMLAKLVTTMGLSVTERDIDYAVQKTSKAEETKLVAQGQAPKTNIYLGKKNEHQWAKDYATERLSHLENHKVAT